jgi:hypothetical protein
VFLGTPIDDTIRNLIMAQLLHLEDEDPDKDINLYVNSPGGDITALFAIYDTMQRQARRVDHHTGQPWRRCRRTPIGTSFSAPREPSSTGSWTRSSPAGRAPSNLQRRRRGAPHTTRPATFC